MVFLPLTFLGLDRIFHLFLSIDIFYFFHIHLSVHLIVHLNTEDIDIVEEAGQDEKVPVDDNEMAEILGEQNRNIEILGEQNEMAEILGERNRKVRVQELIERNGFWFSYLHVQLVLFLCRNFSLNIFISYSAAEKLDLETQGQDYSGFKFEWECAQRWSSR